MRLGFLGSIDVLEWVDITDDLRAHDVAWRDHLLDLVAAADEGDAKTSMRIVLDRVNTLYGQSRSPSDRQTRDWLLDLTNDAKEVAAQKRPVRVMVLVPSEG